MGLLDLTGAGRIIAGETYIVLATYTFIAVVYLGWITLFTKVADIVYEKKRIPGIELSV